MCIRDSIQTVPQLFRALSSQEYTTELTQTLQQAAPRPQSTEEEERKKHILSLRNLLAAILILLAILTLLIVWGLVNQGLHTAKPAESTPASEPASSLVTEPVNLAPDFVGMDYDSQVRNNNSYAGAVSYTHLDVYKRQPRLQARAAPLPPCGRVLLAGAFRFQCRAPAGGPARDAGAGYLRGPRRQEQPAGGSAGRAGAAGEQRVRCRPGRGAPEQSGADGCAPVSYTHLARRSIPILWAVCLTRRRSPSKSRC